jgi:hypothetical protein
MIFMYLIFLFSIWLVVSALLRFLKRVKDPGWGRGSAILKGIHFLDIFPFLGGAFLSLAILKGARIFFSGSLLKSTHVLAASLLVGVILDLLSEILFPLKIKIQKTKRKWAARIIMGLCGVSLLIAVLVLRSMPGSQENALKMSMPFKGKWRVITGGRFRFMNYHHVNPDSQNLAVDFVVAEGGGDASRGQKVFSPVSGTIVRAVGNLREGGWDPPEGNIVIIKTDEGVQVWMCHLQENSVKVSTGERIDAGREIAACGASGGADVPHLHLHAEKNGRAVPMLLGKYRVFPIRGDVISGGK